MGWIDGPDDGNKDQFPVDTLVKKLKATIGEINTFCKGEINTFCKDYHGQARKCCDGVRRCFATMETSFSSVKLQAIGNQNMHKACRKLKTDLQATRSCTVSWTGTCHHNVNAQRLAEPFIDVLEDQQEILDETCNNLPPERTTLPPVTTTTKKTTTLKTTPTTTKSSTTSSSTSSSTTTTSTTTTTTTTTTTATTTKFISTTTEVEKADETEQYTTTDDVTTRNTKTAEFSTTSVPGGKTKPSRSPSTSYRPSDLSTVDPKTSTLKSTNASTSSTASFNNSTSGLSKYRNDDTGSDNTITIVTSVVGGLLFVCAICLFMLIVYKRRQQKNTDSGGSLETVGKPSLFTWFFKSPKTARSENNDTEIYAEIDEAFMEAVYRYDTEKPAIVRDRVSSNSQFNICYDRSFMEGAIISSRETLESKTTTETSIIEPLSPLALIRKDDDAITSFQINQSKPPQLPDSQIHSKTVLSGQKSFLTRRPGFTDIRSDSSGDYVYIEAMPNDVFEEEDGIYAVPSFEVSEYDTAEYGRNPERNIAPVPERDYDACHVYTNIEQPPVQESLPTMQQDVKEYRRSSSDLEIDSHLYENPDTLMEY